MDLIVREMLAAVLVEVRAVPGGQELAAWRQHGGRWTTAVASSGLPGAELLTWHLRDSGDRVPAAARVGVGLTIVYRRDEQRAAAAKVGRLRDWLTRALTVA